MKIALVEDNSIFSTLISERLKNIYCFEEIMIFESAEEFLKSNIIFDFLLLDIELPGINGIALSRKIHTTSRIIFLTSLADRVFEAFGINVVGYIVKTENIDKIMSKIKSIIDSQLNRPCIKARSEVDDISIELAEIVKISIENRKMFIYTTKCVIRIYDLTLNEIINE